MTKAKNRKGKLIRVEVSAAPETLDRLVDALMEDDADSAGDALDSMLLFSGILGGAIERFDGAVMDELADLALELKDRIVSRVAAGIGG
jgi:hypothetical protein